MTGFFETLLRPDRDDDAECGEIARAANLLQIGEFQLLQLAYFSWHGQEMSEQESNATFQTYMIGALVPPWARHYARQIIARAELGDLEDDSPQYHRYDSEYFRAVPLGARRLAVAVACLALVVGGGILVGHLASGGSTSVLPPYFDEKELTPARAEELDLTGGLRGS
jgi:hypothetical protein